MKKIAVSCLALLATGILMFAFSGCGKKGPPVPPGSQVLPPVNALTHTIQKDVLTLTWKAPDGKSAKDLAGYTVLRSMTSLDEKECPGCPILFERAATLGATATSYSETLVKGKRYIYKVTAFTSYKATSKDSTLIRFEFKG